MNRRSLLAGLVLLFPGAAIASAPASVVNDKDVVATIRDRRIAENDNPRAECWHITSQKRVVIYYPDGTKDYYPESMLDYAVTKTLAFNDQHGASYHEFIDGRAPTLAEALHV